MAGLIAQGATNRQIAHALVITEGTAANHVVHILTKLGFGSRRQIAARLEALGTTEDPLRQQGPSLSCT